jgi:hypothetical protein
MAPYQRDAAVGSGVNSTGLAPEVMVGLHPTRLHYPLGLARWKRTGFEEQTGRGSIGCLL